MASAFPKSAQGARWVDRMGSRKELVRRQRVLGALSGPSWVPEKRSSFEAQSFLQRKDFWEEALPAKPDQTLGLRVFGPNSRFCRWALGNSPKLRSDFVHDNFVLTVALEVNLCAGTSTEVSLESFLSIYTVLAFLFIYFMGLTVGRAQETPGPYSAVVLSPEGAEI